MPTHPRTTEPSRLGSAIRSALVMALVLCAVLHGVPHEPHESVPVPAGISATAPGGDPHGSHAPHGAEDCATEVIARTVAHPTGEQALGAMAVVVLLTVSPGAGFLARQESRRRRSARTGRVALVVTSRWRI